ELHNDLTLRYFPRRLPLETWFERQVHVRLDSREVPALSVEDELALICVHGAKHLWERLMWIADVAALVSRQSNLDWKRAAASAREVGAERMLHVGLGLSASLLKLRLAEHVAAKVKSDNVAASLMRQILRWLPAAGDAPPGLFERAAFRLRMRGDLLSAPAYFMRLMLSPTEEDWTTGSEENQHAFLEVLRRPFRLARKYGRARKS
ncbi:MAG: nucleotidyltransferase family protein, partial [Candidatus Acidiferrum sp.]